jgi:hypothetical protein
MFILYFLSMRTKEGDEFAAILSVAYVELAASLYSSHRMYSGDKQVFLGAVLKTCKSSAKHFRISAQW